MKWTSLLFLALGVAIGAIAGCQNYSFEPVVPLAVSQTTQARTITARQDKPNTMLVFDRSGSLTLPIDSTQPSCHPDGGAATCGTFADDCPASCVTRDRAIKSTMGSFLTNYGTVARFGMITFPAASDQCGAGTVRVQIPSASDDATLNAAASNINSILQSSPASGGTPTAATMATLASYAPLLDPNLLDTYILITDGVPNCNANNPHDACNPYNGAPGNGACQCTNDIGNCCPNPCAPNPPGNCAPGQNINPYRQLGCIDADGTAAAMTSLRVNNRISGFVLGVGDETLGNGVTLNAMAEAGGFPRLCPNGTNAECGTNNPCITATRKCTREYYQAGSSQDLGAALDIIRNTLVGDPCIFTLSDTPSDPQLLSVIVNHQPTQPGPNTWTYVPGIPLPKVVFAPSGAICTALTNSTPSNPVTLEFRILQAP